MTSTTGGLIDFCEKNGIKNSAVNELIVKSSWFKSFKITIKEKYLEKPLNRNSGPKESSFEDFLIIENRVTRQWNQMANMYTLRYNIFVVKRDKKFVINNYNYEN